MKNRGFGIRILSFVMSCIMVFGLVPMQSLDVFAAVGSNITTGPRPGAGGEGSGSYGHVDVIGSFTRFSLIEFETKDYAENKDIPYVLTYNDWKVAYENGKSFSMDICGQLNDETANPMWYDTNAMDYRIYGYNVILGSRQVQSNWNGTKKFVIDSNEGELGKLANVSWFESRDVDVNKLIYGTGTNGSINYGEPSFAFGYLVTKLGEKYPNSGCPSIGEFLTRQNGKSYRIFLEPGIIIKKNRSDGSSCALCSTMGENTYALTLRDLFAFSRTIDTGSDGGEHDFGSAFWHRIGDLVYSMYNNAPDLQTYYWDGETNRPVTYPCGGLNSGDTVDKVFVAPKHTDDKYAKEGNTSTTIPYTKSLAANTYFWYMRRVAQGTTAMTVSGAEEYDQNVGYGLGIISPFDFPDEFVASDHDGFVFRKNVVGTVPDEAKGSDGRDSYGFLVAVNVEQSSVGGSFDSIKASYVQYAADGTRISGWTPPFQDAQTVVDNNNPFEMDDLRRIGNPDAYKYIVLWAHDGEYYEINFEHESGQKVYWAVMEMRPKTQHYTMNRIDRQPENGYVDVYLSDKGATSVVNGFAMGNTADNPNECITFTNDYNNETRNGHLVIDYNLPGVAATVGGGGTSDPAQILNQADCGTHRLGDMAQFRLAAKFGDNPANVELTGDYSKVYYNEVIGTDSATGSTASVAIKFKGLYEVPSGGDPVGQYVDATDGSGKVWQYPVTKEGLTVLYAQWDVQPYLTVNTPDDTDPVNPTPTPKPSDEPVVDGSIPKSELYTVYYDYNYNGGGVTSALCGTFYVPIAMKAAEREMYHTGGENCTTKWGDWQWLAGGGGDWSDSLKTQWDVSRSYKITIPFSHPGNPAGRRIGYAFVGWAPGDYLGIDKYGYNKPGEGPSLTKLKTTWSSALGTEFSNGSKSPTIFNDNLDTGTAVGTARNHLNTWITDKGGYNDYYCANGGQVDCTNPVGSKSFTYYAVWLSGVVTWNGNGGYFDRTGDGDGTYFTGNFAEYAGGGRITKSFLDVITGKAISKNFVYVNHPMIMGDSYVDIVGGDGGAPVRLGYDFDTWYLQSGCTIPIAMNEHGVQPTRDYYAGWNPQPVFVNYYDTREGTSLVATHEYKYDDYIDLLDYVSNTSGETWNSWQMKDENGNLVDVTNGQRLSVGRPDDPESSSAGLRKACLLRMADRKNVRDNSQVDYEYYWVLDLYADYTRKTCDYTVTINWDDYSDNDGVRPSAVKVGLVDSRGNQVIRTQVLTSDDADGSNMNRWTYTFTDLDVTTSDASTEKVTYSFCILGYTDAVTGKEWTVSDLEASSGEIQVMTPGVMGNTDAMSSYAYSLSRYSNKGTQDVDKEPTVDREDKNGNKIKAKRYSSYYGICDMNHNLILTGDDIKFTIQWDDDSNRDGLRPQAVTLELYDKNGTKINSANNLAGNSGSQSVSQGMCDVSNDGNTWTYTFKDYQKYTTGTKNGTVVGGQLVGYKVGIDSNTVDSDDYTIQYLNGQTCDENGAIVIHKPSDDAVCGKIVWNDENNRDGQRPDFVDVVLWAYQWNARTYQWERVVMETATVDAVWTDEGGKEVTADSKGARNVSDEWPVMFGIHYDKAGGQDIIYRMEIVSDLNASLRPGSNEYSWTEGIIGPGTPEEGRDADGNRVFRPGDNTVPISVRVYHNTDMRSVDAVVDWQDEANNDGIRPGSIVLDLYVRAQDDEKATRVAGMTGFVGNPKDYSVVLTGDMKAQTWTYTFENLPKYDPDDSGKELVYSVRARAADGSMPLYEPWVQSPNGYEEEFERYKASYVGTNGSSVDANASVQPYVRLTHAPIHQTASFYVQWHDGDNRDGVRPDGVQVGLYKIVGDRDPVYYKTLELVPGEYGTWDATLSGMGYFEDGMPVRYVLEISEDVKAQLAAIGYTTTVQDNVVHLYYTPETGTIKAQLRWDDGNDRDHKRPTNVVAHLVANGVDTGRVAQLNQANDWSAEWADVAVNYMDKSGTTKPVQYSVTVDIDGNDYPTVSYQPETITVPEGKTLYVELSRVQDTLDHYPVEILWNDGNDNGNTRPASVKLALMKNGELYDSDHVVTVGPGLEGTTVESNKWTYDFGEIPEHDDDGSLIEWSVAVYSDAGWKDSYEYIIMGNTVYFHKDVAKSGMYVSFQFDDNNNADGDRPRALYLTLKADNQDAQVNDTALEHTVSFDTNVDGYKWVFDDLPVYGLDGQKISYSVDVQFDSEFGSTDYAVWTTRPIKLGTGNETANQVIVKLSKSVRTADRTGVITWYDLNDRFGARPDAITVLVTNTHSGAKTDYVIDMAAGTVTNRVTGNIAGTVGLMSESASPRYSRWKYTITDLQYSYWNDASHKPEPIYYYTDTNLGEAAVDYAAVLDGEKSGMDATLMHRFYEDYADKAATDRTVTILWQDNSNAWGYRPDTNGVKVELVATAGNAESVKATRVYTAADMVNGNPNAWSYHFADLPTFESGAPIVYTVRVSDAKGYAKSFLVDMETDKESVVSMVQSVGFDLTANWDDDANDDAFRPAVLELDVYADGRKVTGTELRGQGDTWYGSLSDLPVWREDDPDAAINYTFRWSERTFKALEDNEYRAKPSIGGTVQTDLSGFYWLSVDTFGDNTLEGYDDLAGTYDWETTISRDRDLDNYGFEIVFDDEGDNDGLRGAIQSVTLELLANGVVVDTADVPVDLTDGPFRVEFADKPVRDGGETVKYRVRVADEKAYDGYEIVYDGEGMSSQVVTLRHEPKLIDVSMSLNWLDETEKHDVYNLLNGKLAYTYYRILRRDAALELYKDGVLETAIDVPKAEYGDANNLAASVTKTVSSLRKYRDHGIEIEYTMGVTDMAGGNAVTGMKSVGYEFTPNDTSAYKLGYDVSKQAFDVTGTVWYLYTHNDDFRLAGVPVTAYRKQDGNNIAVQTTVTGDDGTFRFTNLPNGEYIVRATYLYNNNSLAGTTGVVVDRANASATVIVDHDSAADGGYYKYTATGRAFYQTDSRDEATKRPVEDGVVLLFRLDDTTREPIYVAMATTDADGNYSFGNLESAEYVINVMFNYDGGSYTYDNADAVADGNAFRVTGADAIWPDVVKQVNREANPGDPDVPPVPVDPDVPPEESKACVLSGGVFYSDDGAHTTDPVEGVDVYVYEADSDYEVGRGVTGADGRWTVSKIPTGNYVAVFSYKANASRVLRFQVTDAEYQAGAKTLAEQYFDRGAKVPTGTISGVVLDESGKPSRSVVYVYDTRSPDEFVDMAATDINGCYQFTVVAGYEYRVVVMGVTSEETGITVGTPGDGYTEVDHFELSGTWGPGGTPEEGTLVAVYEERDGDFRMVTAALTDADGRYVASVERAGNYMVCPYVNNEIYDRFYVSVGLEDDVPRTYREINDTWTIEGNDAYDSIVVVSTRDGVERTVYQSDVPGTGYRIRNLGAGTYRIELARDGVSSRYYVACPTGLQVDVACKVRISGEVVGQDGRPVDGGTARLEDADGNEIGKRFLTTRSDAKYGWADLPKGSYTLYVGIPNATVSMADRTTSETDSYGNAYPGGMAEDKAWNLNVNAVRVGGTVADQDGGPIGNAMVTFRAHGGKDVRGVLTDSNGRYDIGLAPGSYDVECFYDWGTGYRIPGGSLSYKVYDADVLDEDFTIQRGTAVIRTVRHDGSAAPNAELKVYINGDGSSALYWEGTTDARGEAEISFWSWPRGYRAEAVYDGTTGRNGLFSPADGDVVDVVIESTVYVAGTVTGVDGKPVPDGFVHYDDGNGLSGMVRTADDGSYRIAIPYGAMGEFQVWASYDVYTGDKVTVDVQADSIVNLNVSGSTSETDMTISGTVVDEADRRLSGAVVTIKWGDDKANTRTTGTDSEGNYKFTVPVGTYYLTAEWTSPDGVVYETNAERAVHLVDADVDSAHLAVMVRYGTDIIVRDADGQPVDKAAVTWNGASSGSAVTGEDGMVHGAKLPAGGYTFTASTESRTGKTVSVDIPHEGAVELVLDVVAIRTDLPELVGEGTRVYGYVYAPDGKPVSDVAVRLERYDVYEDGSGQWVDAGSTVSGSDGAYGFPGLEKAVYRVSYEYPYGTAATASGSSYVVAGDLVGSDGNPMLDCTVTLYIGGSEYGISTALAGRYEFALPESYATSGQPMTLLVRDATQKIVYEGSAPAVTAKANAVSGIAKDVAGRPVAGATVVLLSGGNEVARMVTGTDGSYAFDVPAGDYALSFAYPAEYQVDAMGGYERDETDRNAPYITPTGYVIRGVVNDMDGRPVEGATAILKDEAKTEIDRMVTGADGRYEFRLEKDGIYYVEIVRDGVTEKTYKVDATNGDVSEDGASGNIDVQVVSYAGDIIETPAGGWRTGNNVFHVSGDRAVIVLLEHGDDTAVLTCNESHMFTADLVEGDRLVVILVGDADLNGRVNSIDATCVLRYGIGHYPVDEKRYRLHAMDANRDGKVNSIDATCILRYGIKHYKFRW